MVDFRPLLFANALAIMLLVTAGFASLQESRTAAQSVPEHATPAEQTADTGQPAQAGTQELPEPGTGDRVEKPSQPAASSSPVFADLPEPSPQSGGATTKAQKAGQPAPGEPAFTIGGGSATAGPADSGKDSPAEPTATEQVLALAEPAPPLPQVSEPEPEPEPARPAPPPAPKTGELTLRSNVYGDKVFINGKSYGSTRLDVTLEPGEYEIVVSKDGHKPWKETVQLAAGEQLTLMANLEEYRKVKYRDGKWRGGVVTGEGTYVDADGLRYQGDFVDRAFHGYGRAEFPDGSVYEGEWVEGQMHGRGTLKMANGDTYTGQFREGEFHGEGTLTKSNGDIYTGHWVNGELNGQGSLTTKDGLLYVGGFIDGQFHGQGTLTYPDGRHYEGGFANGRYHGKGEETLASGKKYVGQFMEGQYHGEGTVLNPNGSKITGTFRYGEPYGEVKLVTPEGEEFRARTSEPGICYREGSYRATQCPKLEGW